MEKIRGEREERKRDKDLTEAKEKLQTSKRLSLEDFRLLLEKGEINLEKPKEEGEKQEEQQTTQN
jgi:hypothetical protein